MAVRVVESRHNQTSATVKQPRMGALQISQRVRSPDIEDFVSLDCDQLRSGFLTGESDCVKVFENQVRDHSNTIA
jgi:hypothetical protein